MTFIQNMVVGLITRSALAIGRVLPHISDRSLVFLSRLARIILRDPGARDTLDEVTEILQAGPPGTTVLRKMITATRPAELRDAIAGALYFKEMGPE